MMKRTGIFLALFGSGVMAFSMAQAGGVAVKPHQEIQLADHAWGCLSKDNLDSALNHERNGQTQAKQQYFDDFRCLSVPQGERFRVVSVDHGDVQFVNAQNNDEQGLWTNARFIKQ